MATIRFDGADLLIEMSVGEKIAAIRGNLAVPLAKVTGASIVPKNFWLNLGLRMPGTGLPPFIVAGTFIKKADTAFVSYRKGQTPVEIVLTGHRFARLVVGVASQAEAEQVISALAA